MTTNAQDERANARPMTSDRRGFLRKALTAGAAGATVALPPIALANASGPDAEILALRAEFVRLNDAYRPINEAAWKEADSFRARVEENGWEAACAWATATGHEGRNEVLEQMGMDLTRLLKRMLDIGPTTLAGFAAVAATLREDALVGYWREPPADRDWDVEVVTRLIDALAAGPGGTV